MSTPVDELSAPRFYSEEKQKKDDKDDKEDKDDNDDKNYKGDNEKPKDGDPNSDDDTYVHSDGNGNNNHLTVDTAPDVRVDAPPRSPSAAREERLRLEDDLALLEAERVVSRSTHEDQDEDGDRQSKRSKRSSVSRSRSRKSRDVDEFDEATNPLHEKAAVYNPPENPNTSFSRFIKKLHTSSFVVRYLTYIVPVVVLLLIPLLLGALKYKDTSVGGVELLWFSVWLEIFWLTLWAGRILAKCIPVAVGLLASIFTNNAKKWRGMAQQLELHGALFFWFLGVEISFLPTMKNHHVDGDPRTRGWENTLNKIIISVFVWTIVNLIEKFIIQLIAMSFHMRTYADRIEINKFQIGSLTKLYAFSTSKIGDKNEEFEENNDATGSGTRTPFQYAKKAQKTARGAMNKVTDVAGAVAADFTGRKANKSTNPNQVVITLLQSTSGSQVLARRLYRTFVRPGFDTVFAGDLKEAFDNNDEADAAFMMFDKDMNGDISMEELESVCVEIGRDRKSITASLKDLDSVVGRLDNVFSFLVFIIVLLVFLSLISTSAAGVLTSAGSTILALSWLFSATAQEFLQSVIFVFVKHPFDVGDRVTIYGPTGATGMGDDYFVKQISLLYTEFKKMEGHIVQAPNSNLNNLFILNQRRSGGLAEAVPIVIKYGTTLDQINSLRQRLLEFVRSEKREYQSNILTELREVTENYSLTLNVVFFYKSNWQNELLRLTRRNKFICMLMVTLQEVGIEGPRFNLPGGHVNVPFHLRHLSGPPQAMAAPDSSEGPAPTEHTSGEGGTGSSISNRHPSILRKGMDKASARARGESSSRKHVDFSLGMSNVTAEDTNMGDVFEDRGDRATEVVREYNREANDRRIQAIREEEEERRSRASSPRASRSNLSVRTRDEPRRSGESQSVRSITSSINRNRFFRHRNSVGNDRADLMEQGRFDQEKDHNEGPAPEYQTNQPQPPQHPPTSHY